MTDNHLTLFCLVDGKATSNAFSIEIEQTKTVDHLKDLIKAKKTIDFNDIDAEQLTLWKVAIPDDDEDEEVPILLSAVSTKDRKKLKATRELEEFFTEPPLKKTIHIIVQRPPQVPDCRQTFSSASWAVLQVCPYMFQDVFSELFSILYDRLKGLKISELALMPIIQNEFLSVQETLATHAYPNFLSGTKLRLVVDEAQILSDKSGDLFLSSYLDNNLQPMLSPILKGFRKAAYQDLTIIYCGTGLSIRTVHWALSGPPDVKEARSEMFPYFEFPSWTGRDSIQSYIERVMDHLPDKESKNMLGSLLPPAAIAMLHERLTGRFRPVVMAIEEIISHGDPVKWESKINDTEATITSWKDRKRRGNLCGEILCLESKITQNPDDFTSRTSLRETLALFLFRYCMLNVTEIVLEDEVQLVEAAFGRMKIFEGAARTVLDEPFVLKATFNYFREKDPSLVSAAERAMLHSDNALVHGNMWEAMMPPVFLETFKSRPLSSWPLLTNSSLPGQLTGDATIVGHDEQQPKLATSHRNLTIQQFMKAHVENGSKQGDQDIPPFYFPAPHVSGPDIVFFVRINGSIYPCFVQLKLRQVLEGSDVEKALAAVSSHAKQEKMDREQEKIQKCQKKQQKQWQQDSAATVQSDQQQPPRLQDYCPTGTYISMVITYPAEIVNFQVVRPDPEPELEGLQRVSIGIDDNNFPKIFPRRHIEFLNELKGHKRRLEDQQSQKSKKKRPSDPLHCDEY
ncbi:hypothetical protein BGX30_004020 [Mortierella sp. GBA39]|nr:hypothetical protein BGX30_004020 [Mortierella sp. GBA39]